MTNDLHTEILEGIRAYVAEHFPNADLHDRTDATTGNVIFHGTGKPRFSA